MTTHSCCRWCWKAGLVGTLAISGAILASARDCAFAQSTIIPDQTLGTESSVIRTDSNLPNVDIIERGAVQGANLFHSFSQFNVAPDGGALFIDPGGIENILSRVTGGSPSQIEGFLATRQLVGGSFSPSNANLFLMNPNGIVLGPNASLDIGGSFVATTADAMRLGDTGLFSASEPATSNLLTVNPSALFFNALANQAEIVNRSTATVPDGQSLSLVGGNVSLDGGILFAPGGRVELGGLAEAGTVGLDVDDNNLRLSFPDQVARADVSLTNRALVNVAAGGGGDIAVNARNLDISGGSILNAGILPNLGSVESKAGDIEINATDRVKIEGEASAPSGITNSAGDLTGTTALGSAGDIIINTGSLELIGNATIGSSTNGQGNAGRVTITASDRVSLSGVGSIIISTVGPFGVGNGADITITTQSLDLSDSSLLSTGTFGQGNSGNIQINATDSVSVDSGSSLLALSVGQGDAGNIVLNAPDAIVSFDGFKVLDDGSFSVTSAQTTTGSVGFTGTGQGGGITITAKSLSITNGAQLSTSTLGQVGPDGKLANAGNILVNAADFVTVSGGSKLSTATNGEGNAGNVTIDAPDATVSFDGVGIINLDSSLIPEIGGIVPSIPGEIGGIVPIPSASGIVSTVNALPSFTGDRQGGDINITAESLSLTNGAQLLASTAGRGNAGDINVDVDDGTVAFDGINFSNLGFSSISFRSGLFSTVGSGAVGNGGTIDLKAGLLSLTNGAQVLTSVSPDSQLSDGTVLPPGQGNGGTVDINAGDITLDGSDLNQLGAEFPSQISSSIDDGATGNGGTVNIQADSLSLSDNAVIDSTLGSGAIGKGGDINLTNLTEVTVTDGAGIRVDSRGQGNGGNLELEAGSLTLDNGFISAATASGEGGIVTLEVEDLLQMRHESQISAEARGTANGGNVNINTNFLVAFPEENSDIIANASEGRGGNIQITAQGIFGTQFREELTPQSDVNASSEFGVDGVVEVNTRDVDVQNSLTPLSANFVNPEQVVAGSCLARRNAEQGSFTVTGTGGLPRSPYEAISGQFTVAGVQPIQGNSSVSKGAAVVKTPPWKLGDPIQQAQGMVVTADGRTIVGTNSQLVALAKAQDFVCRSN